ncbi:TlpA disulfide reductase family protein [Lutibacter sp.]|uniref:TlpA family protein disulfide reductase n=1 Tax=Lutibacter sp. TaxID=1925666 RepID=UPI001A2FCA89|nr:TlpA disulfide reductase family protein [Lutibacter sp.]MBI9041498.1 TlpA family protein disulfide reductase [Lutibacter sp.]
MNEQSYLTITNFIKDYPNSYVGFWEIAISISYNGYNEELENAYNNLSVKIKQSEVAKVFENNITNAKTLKIGSYFPKIKLKNKGLKEVEFITKKNSSPNYTLIDFWFSYCGPCIAQFPKLKKLHAEYNSNQLKIISISTDKTKNIDNWYKVMEKHTIPWLNLLDENGVKTTGLGVNSFPTNYLLNKEGIILKKNISLVELEELLKEVE